MAFVNEYPRRKPNPIVKLLLRFVWFVVAAVSILLQFVWLLVLVLLILAGIVILAGMLMAGWWWIAPIALLYTFCVVVLFRNRRSRLRGLS